MSAVALAQLKVAESVIERGQQTFVEVGQALAKIRDRRLFREAGYHSFADYCQERWGFKRAYAYSLISGAEVSAMADIPISEREAGPCPWQGPRVGTR